MNTRIVKATVKQRQCQRERQKSIRFNKRNNNFAFVSHFWYISLPASFPGVSFPMLSCAQRKVRRRKRASLPFSFSWSLALRHQAFALAFVDCWRTKCENDAPEAGEEAVSRVKTLYWTHMT